MALQLTNAGLQTQTQQEIVDEMTAKLRATFGTNLNTLPDSIMGQLVNIISEMRAVDQQALLAAYRSFDPSTALGVALDRIAALTGSVRKAATVSTVDVVLTFNAAGTAANGDLFQNDDTGTQWEITGGPYVAGAAGDIAGALSSIDTGEILANAGTTWSLVTANPDLDGVTNPADDANLGQALESDVDFRVRRQTEIYAGNVGGLAAIRGVVSQVDGVTSVSVYHNPDVPGADSDGIPFKAYNVVVETNPTPPGVALQEEIADAILSVNGAGGQPFGTDYSLARADSEGTLQTIQFDLIDPIDVFVSVIVNTGGTEQPVTPNMASVIEAAILAEANESFSGIGQNQLGFEYSAIVADLQASGEITGAVTVTVSLSRVALVGPFVDPVPIGIRERPDFDSVNISVSVIAV